MQIMPFHSGKYGCASPDLYNVEANICHGVAILSEYMGRTKSVEKALLRYNGVYAGPRSMITRSMLRRSRMRTR